MQCEQLSLTELLTDLVNITILDALVDHEGVRQSSGRTKRENYE
jgi:hypothetical protein